MTSTTFGHKKCLDKWGAVQDLREVLLVQSPIKGLE